MEAPSHQKVNLEGTQLSPHLECQFGVLCDEFKDILSQQKIDIGDAKPITMDIEMEDHPPMAQNLILYP